MPDPDGGMDAMLSAHNMSYMMQMMQHELAMSFATLTGLYKGIDNMTFGRGGAPTGGGVGGNTGGRQINPEDYEKANASMSAIMSHMSGGGMHEVYAVDFTTGFSFEPQMFERRALNEAWDLSNSTPMDFEANLNGVPNGGSVDYGNYTVSSPKLKAALNEFAANTGMNVIVTSGDRTAARNAAAGGANASRHLSGDAVDIAVPGISNQQLAEMAHGSGLFNTTIYYPNIEAIGALRPHVHLDLNPNHNNLFLMYTPTIIDGRVIKNMYSPYK